jgi:hypothetical protein
MTTAPPHVAGRMARGLLAAHAAGRVEVAIGRASDYFPGSAYTPLRWTRHWPAPSRPTGRRRTIGHRFIAPQADAASAQPGARRWHSRRVFTGNRPG